MRAAWASGGAPASPGGAARATMVSTLDGAFAARGNPGGRFRLPAEAALEPEAAACKSATSSSMSRPIS
jgi:hypothetical protein